MKKIILLLSLICSSASFASFEDYPVYSYLDKTANYTLKITDVVVDADTSSSAFQITLPSSVGLKGKIYTVKLSVAGHVLTIGTTSAQTIDGASTITFSTAGNYVTLLSDGSNWLNISTSTTPAANITGTVGVAQGGTGLGTLTSGGVMIGAATSTPTFVTCSTSGFVLQWNGSAWVCGAVTVSGYVAQTSATGEAQLPGGTTAQRSGSPANGDIRKNTTTGTIEFYNNGHYFPLELGFDTATNSTTVTATGAFTFTVPTGVTKMSAILVGGGAGGGGVPAVAGGSAGGGGGGGSVVYIKNIDVIPGLVISGYVGLGGLGYKSATGAGDGGSRGQASCFAGYCASGGGGGTARSGNGVTGGNGGGQISSNNNSGYDYNATQASNLVLVNTLINQTSFGYFVGGTSLGTNDTNMLAGGGGGSSAVGGNAVAATRGGNGGAGITINGTTYGGGGGGGAYGGSGTVGGTGGSGGGGNGATGGNGSNGTANTGGGGGGCGVNTTASCDGGTGGTGKVIYYWYL